MYMHIKTLWTMRKKLHELPTADVFAVKNQIAKIYIYTGKIKESIQLINETIVQDPTNLL